MGEGFAYFRWHALTYNNGFTGCTGYYCGRICRPTWDRLQGRDTAYWANGD